MEWWQVALIVVAAIFIGILIGISCYYLFIRFVKKDRVKFLDLFYLLFSKKPKVFTSNDLARQSISTPSASPEVHEPTEFPIPELLVEFEHNQKIVTEFSGDNLLPLQTDAWDAHKYLAHKLPVNLREQLEEVYSDVNSLNNMVSFSTNLDYRSSFLDERYKKLLTSIAERLQIIKQNM